MGTPARAIDASGLVDHVCHVHDGPDDLLGHGVAPAALSRLQGALVIDARGLTFVNHWGLEAFVEGLARPAGGLTLLWTNALPALLRGNLGIDEALLDVLPWAG